MAVSEYIYLLPRGWDKKAGVDRHMEALLRAHAGRIPKNLDPSGQKTRIVYEGDLPIEDLIHRAQPEAKVVSLSVTQLKNYEEIIQALTVRKKDRVFLETLDPYHQHTALSDEGLVVLRALSLSAKNFNAVGGGLQENIAGRFQRKFSDAIIQEMKELKRSGRKPQEIAGMFNCSRSFVFKVTKEIPTVPRIDDYGKLRAEIVSLEEDLTRLALDERSTSLLITFFSKYENKNTQSLYIKDLEHFLTIARQKGEIKSLNDVNDIHVMHWTKSIRQRLKPRSFNRHLSTMRALFKHLDRKKYLRENPFEEVGFSKISDRMVVTKKPSLDEMTAIIKEAERLRVNEKISWKKAKLHRNELAFKLLCGAGMRVGALAEVKLSDIKDRDGKVTLRLRSKGSNDQYEIPLDPLSVKTLKEYMELYHQKSSLDHYLLFESIIRPHKPVLTKSIHRSLCDIVKSVGANPDITVHSFRVFAAVEWYRSGMSIRDIQVRLNHKSNDQTAKYIAIEQDLPPEEFYEKLKGVI